MKTSIWMPLYIADYTADTIDLTNAEHGAYLMSMMCYWRKRGALADSELKSICKTEFERVARFFKLKDGIWIHKRIEEEMAEAELRAKNAKDRADKASAARWGAAKKDQDETDDQDEVEDGKAKSRRFQPPTIEECQARAEEIGMSCDEGERFFNYYGSKGWKVGQSPMKNWHMAMANWLKNGIEKGTIIIQQPPAPPPKKRTEPIFQVPGLSNEWTLDRGPARNEFKEGFFGDCQMSEYSAMYERWKRDYLKAIGNRATPANGV